MPESSPCHNAKILLKEVSSLKEAFHAAHLQATRSKSEADIKRVREAKSLLEQKMETMGESRLERLFNIREQYAFQVNLLKKGGFVESRIELNALGKEQETIFIRGIDEKEYPLPSINEVFKRLLEKREFFEMKAEQGFTELVFTPFGMSLNSLMSRFMSYIKATDEAKGERVLFKHVTPIDSDGDYWMADTKGSLIYAQSTYESTSEHFFVTKSTVLKRQEHAAAWDKGWRIQLFQTPKDGEGIQAIPALGKGETRGETHKRLDIEAGEAPSEYYKRLHPLVRDPRASYYGESGMTPEDWLIAFIHQYEKTGTVLDSCSSNSDVSSYLVDARFGKVVYRALIARWRKNITGKGMQGSLSSSSMDKAKGNVCGPRHVVRL